ncbi:MAG TPA: hypothetical protein VNX29_16090 [Kaistia sp.]|nr:hypothetical protein [Kaistia sp.]
MRYGDRQYRWFDALARSRAVRPADLRVAWIIATAADPATLAADLSLREIGLALGIPRATIGRAVSRLVGLGGLAVELRAGRDFRNRYQLEQPPSEFKHASS